MTLFDEISGLYKEEKRKKEERWNEILEKERNEIIDSMRREATQGVGILEISFSGYVNEVQSFLCRELIKFFENEGFIVERKGGNKLIIRWDKVETSTRVGMLAPNFSMMKEPDRRQYYAEIHGGR